MPFKDKNTIRATAMYQIKWWFTFQAFSMAWVHIFVEWSPTGRCPLFYLPHITDYGLKNVLPCNDLAYLHVSKHSKLHRSFLHRVKPFTSGYSHNQMINRYEHYDYVDYDYIIMTMLILTMVVVMCYSSTVSALRNNYNSLLKHPCRQIFEKYFVTLDVLF